MLRHYKPGTPYVRASTYGNKYCSAQIVCCFGEEWKYDDPRRPVLMRGAKFVRIARWTVKSQEGADLRNRYFRYIRYNEIDRHRIIAMCDAVNDRIRAKGYPINRTREYPSALFFSGRCGFVNGVLLPLSREEERRIGAATAHQQYERKRELADVSTLLVEFTRHINERHKPATQQTVDPLGKVRQGGNRRHRSADAHRFRASNA